MIKKEKGFVLSYKGLEEKNNVMGEDRAVTTVTGCVSPVEQGAVLVLGRMRESSSSRHVPVRQWKCKWRGRDICALRFAWTTVNTDRSVWFRWAADIFFY